MSSDRIERIEHPALADGTGLPLLEAELSDQARLAVVLQAAGLLSLCEVTGQWPVDGFGRARIRGDGRLLGVAIGVGDGAHGSARTLRELLLMLFRAEDGVAGRGAARRAARTLADRWAGAPDGFGADRAVADLLELAPFLERPAHAAARAALDGWIVRADRRVAWRAGRRTDVATGTAENLEALVSTGRYRAAARLGRAQPELAASSPLAYGRALAATGRLEQALFVIEGHDNVAAEILRAECRFALGELGAAREAVRRLEARELSVDERLAAGDVALRVLARSREPEAARDWAARAVAAARGGKRVAARRLAALAAIDRGELDAGERLLDETRGQPTDARGEALETEVRLQVALARNDGPEAARRAAERLARRRELTRIDAGRAWNNLGYARSLMRDFGGAERAYGHARRLLHQVDGPLELTLAAANLADARLRVGKLRGVEEILEASTRHNRRSGNLRGELEDELLWARLDWVRGDLARAVERCRRARARDRQLGTGAVAGRLAVLEARVLGWLERAAEARAALAEAGNEDLGELEPEELPFLFALAGDADAAVARAEASPSLAVPLVRGESPPRHRWRDLDPLEPYRRARFVVDAELAAPGSTPRDRRAEAAAVLRRLGAERVATICERGEAVAWRALAGFFARPSGDRAAIEELLAAVGHPEAELLVRGGDGERLLAGAGRTVPGADRAERTAALDPEGASELVLRAGEIDEPLRALFALFLRDLPTADARPASAGGSPLAGDSPALRAAVERLRKFAASELPVLIFGENGTGKELAAAEVHRASSRRPGTWVPVNCAGLSETLLLSELFGHVRGAFTGADQPRAGVFETARGGTVFLDEIGDLPLPAQGALLRVLQEKEIRRLGESLPRKVDARVVAATNRDLEAMVEQGSFRQDLYFRLKVATVLLPPLRERGGDVLLLAERFLDALRSQRPHLRLTPEARRALAAHSWPGNVRELKHALEAAAALADDGRIGVEHLDLETRKVADAEGDYHRRVEEFRRRLITGALEASEGSLAGAARQLGVTRQFLSQFVRKYGLDVHR